MFNWFNTLRFRDTPSPTFASLIDSVKLENYTFVQAYVQDNIKVVTSKTDYYISLLALISASKLSSFEYESKLFEDLTSHRCLQYLASTDVDYAVIYCHVATGRDYTNPDIVFEDVIQAASTGIKTPFPLS